MNENKHFDHHWVQTLAQKKGQEFSLYVKEGDVPRTQRQFNLYHYMEQIDALVRDKNYQTSLELGAGRGTISLYLKKRFGIKTTLNDISEQAMQLAKANFQFYNESANFDVADASNLPYPDNSFDIVTSIGLLEHLENYEPILKEAYRVLKPNGVMVQINIPKKFSIQYINTLYRIILEVFGKKLRPDFPRNSDTPTQYAEHAKNAGFKEVETINVNPFPLLVPVPMVIDRILTYLYRAIMKIRSWILKKPYRTNHMVSHCHFLIGYK